MRDISVEDRLVKINQLPHKASGGNTLPRELMPIVGYLNRRIPEVIVQDGLRTQDKFFPEVCQYSEGVEGKDQIRRLASSLADVTKRDSKKFFSNCENTLSLKGIDVRAFYDSQTDVTHYFLYPKETSWIIL